ncbi:hypothetical protein T8K17_23030 [Thalassobaculum sp. OXR-137]|uniref:hypothetical protein n=1 Tax=Thalassobaculum sp. OXR-137 TaxID=3100173 RepID=UPI002AC92CB1|nr:hypothetical protein [Thalassobaculum sp. OXR-137]WPZ34099.1 hypothetical protein T8K17_23030 [Thalassobaculum sp. OXR-137]
MLPSKKRKHGYHSHEYEARVRDGLREAGIESMDLGMRLFMDISWSVGRPPETCISVIIERAAAE